MPSRSTTAPDSGSARLDRAAVAGLGLAGFVLSLDALRQMAAAAHIRPGLTWLFPLILDGFTAYSIRALIVLRNAPLAARAYVWLLLATATGVSIWANVLHAVLLNQAPFTPAPDTHSDTRPDLELGSDTVGVLAACAPLALAAAAHLHTLITRHTKATTTTAPAPDASTRPPQTTRGPLARGYEELQDAARDHEPTSDGTPATEPTGTVLVAQDTAVPNGSPDRDPDVAVPGQPVSATTEIRTADGPDPANPHSTHTKPHTQPLADPYSNPPTTPETEAAARPETEPGTEHGMGQRAESTAAATRPAARRGRPPGADLDTLTAIGRAATLDQGKPVTRDTVEQAIRDQNLPISGARLADIVRRLKTPTPDTTAETHSDNEGVIESGNGSAAPSAA
ncbi:hypothetical protein GCM10023205_12010 [Yinghuangia aomiensis]|uniref:DUF2637 domain-containing protein n=1 Tax=Yinghuangia aomiensis TaxID=676205 RepID=A0ABP9GTL9_9ACTN